MLIRRFAPVPKSLSVHVSRSFSKYPYFENYFSSPPRVPQYFVMYNDMFKKSKSIEIKNSLRETFKQTETVVSPTDDEAKAEFKAVLDKFKMTTDALVDEANPEVKVDIGEDEELPKVKGKRGKRRVK